ncbi:MAG: zinc-binding dehydrogenase, partial [Verrucomicrobia bacterium]|nr:zinc-binding dehydrogenase [Verrucomicrobiota bacterium]
MSGGGALRHSDRRSPRGPSARRTHTPFADRSIPAPTGRRNCGRLRVILGTSNSVEAMADSIAGLHPDGRLVLMGFENKPLAVHPGDLITRRIRILGGQQNDREYLHEALQIAASGKVKVMAETYSLDEITKAYERVADGKVRFRA